MTRLEKEARQMARAFKVIHKLTGAFTIHVSFGDRTTAQIQPEPFERLAGGHAAPVTATGILDYPYQQSVVIGGVKFFCLMSEKEKQKKDGEQ